MQKKNTTTKETSKPRIRRGDETMHLLTILEETPLNRPPVLRIHRALVVWSTYLLEINPAFRGTLYKALCDEWTKRVRGVLYDNDLFTEDEHEKYNVMFNSEVIFALSDARSDETFSDSWESRREATKAAVRTEFNLLTKRFANGQSPPPIAATKEGDDPIDLLCWRQSHPRPLKGGAQ